jgi:predicted AAA+ superfamily ATPase
MLVKRDSFDDLIKCLKKSEILILIGARQVGKTHLMIELGCQRAFMRGFLKLMWF